MYKKSPSPIAFMTPHDARCMKELLLGQVRDRSLNVLEWGAGISTTMLYALLLDHRVWTHWTTIESNERFFRKYVDPIVRRFPSHRMLYCSRSGREKQVIERLFPSDPNRLTAIVVNLGSLHPLPYSTPERRVSGEAYVQAPRSLNRKFDVIFVDGRFRRRCLLEALDLLAPGGVTILHDAWRKHYAQGMAAYPYQAHLGEELWIGANEAKTIPRLLCSLSQHDVNRLVQLKSLDEPIEEHMIGRTYRVDDGMVALTLTVTNDMIGKRFGDFQRARRFRRHVKLLLGATAQHIPGFRYML